ncbi:hypothetical protein NP233_g9574 [Leucocoprinus birnbaumii]|uniref:Uncharacterized protein n=1 Tax=Leucocoprinus birnbaumii TaxID=56174 RepID=A0AAD5VKC5_9AGAR|nr:hypothetical protein NP233_g9574 [Leucocoprinus birnbaumii]
MQEERLTLLHELNRLQSPEMRLPNETLSGIFEFSVLRDLELTKFLVDAEVDDLITQNLSRISLERCALVLGHPRDQNKRESFAFSHIAPLQRLSITDSAKRRQTSIGASFGRVTHPYLRQVDANCVIETLMQCPNLARLCCGTIYWHLQPQSNDHKFSIAPATLRRLEILELFNIFDRELVQFLAQRLHLPVLKISDWCPTFFRYLPADPAFLARLPDTLQRIHVIFADLDFLRDDLSNVELLSVSYDTSEDVISLFKKLTPSPTTKAFSKLRYLVLENGRCQKLPSECSTAYLAALEKRLGCGYDLLHLTVDHASMVWSYDVVFRLKALIARGVKLVIRIA